MSINQSINQSIKSFINVSRIFSLQANWGHNGKVHKVKVQLELLKNLKNLLKKKPTENLHQNLMYT